MVIKPKTIITTLALFIFLLILITKILLFPSPQLISFLSPQICPEAIYFVDTNQPVIALTIDDSPNDTWTQEILKVLATNQVHATFFLISEQVKNYPNLATKIIQQGHEIGNHLTRDEPSIKFGNKFEPELLAAQNVLSEFAQLRWLRPGGGWCNASMVQTAKKHNYQLVLGSVWSYDTHISSARFSSWFILNNIRSGAIIILHDGETRGKRTVATLKQVLPQLHKRGYQVVSLSELILSTPRSQDDN